MALTNRQKAFVEAYLANGFNATQAAITAGYSAKTARFMGSENLTKPNIASLIAERMKALTMSADEALYRLSQTARGNLTEYISLSVAELKAHPQSQILKKFKRTLTTYGELPSAMTEEKIELELYDAQAAQLAILKEQHLRAGEATDKVDVDVDDSKARDARDKLERALARLAERNGQSGTAEQSDG